MPFLASTSWGLGKRCWNLEASSSAVVEFPPPYLKYKCYWTWYYQNFDVIHLAINSRKWIKYTCAVETGIWRQILKNIVWSSDILLITQNGLMTEKLHNSVEWCWTAVHWWMSILIFFLLFLRHSCSECYHKNSFKFQSIKNLYFPPLKHLKASVSDFEKYQILV